MIPLFGATRAERRLLTEGRLSGPMPWVIAIMMFLTVLAAAGGIGLAYASSAVTGGIAQRVTVQIVEANPDLRDEQAGRVVRMLDGRPGVTGVDRISEAEIAALLEPYIGSAGSEEGIPAPALIDVDLTLAAHARLGELEAAIREIAPKARVDDHANFLAPLHELIRSLALLSLGLMLLTAGATGAVVILAIRSALNTHRGTIEVLHMMGATDIQIARLFQRRIALDALLGGTIGFLAAIIAILLLGQRIGAVGSELLGSVTLPWYGWLVLCLLPIAGAAIGTFAARWTVLGRLRKTL